MTANFDRTAKWLENCGKEPGVEAHSSVQIGCHLEEFAEFLRAIRVNSEGGRLVIDRTIADLDGADTIKTSHLAEAIHYRNLDREGWGM